MDAAEIALKLRDIARLPEGELRGWWNYVVKMAQRPVFDGERAALMARAKQVGISL